MKKLALYLMAVSFLAAGCVVRTYPVTRDRVDQDLVSGNRGFLQGSAPLPGDRKATRTTQIVEVEMYPPIRFDNKPKRDLPRQTTSEFTRDTSLTEGNRGYITQSVTPEIDETTGSESYTVQKNDTLQKISQKFYGTTRKWKKIYDANRAVLKGPNKVYPGQVINIPAEGLKEPPQNLK